MWYIVITKDPHTGEQSAFETRWFDESKFNPDFDMIVIDCNRNLITFDGETWEDIEKDHL